MNKNYLLMLLACTLLTACASLPVSSPKTTIVGSSGNACTGSIITPPAGLVEIKDAALLQASLGEAGKGMLCEGKVFVAEKPIVVYRVWDASKTYTALGRWWSLNHPQGPKTQYQHENDICPEWSALDRLSQCTLKIGAYVVIGTGQSATCAEGVYPQSGTNQVYVPNDAQQNRLWVENCSEGVGWP